MLNALPQLLVYSFFSATLLRLGLACFFFYLFNYHIQHRKLAAKEISMLTSKTAQIVILVYAFVECAVGVGLFIGLETQLAAFICLILCIKILFLKKSLHYLAPLTHTTYILLAIIALSLCLTGAGALAFDLPL